MKNPWIVLTAICAIVVGIVMFSVVFGGYSSLLRSQNRINETKLMLLEQCALQVELARQLSEGKTDVSGTDDTSNLARNAETLQSILGQMNTGKMPMNPEVVEQFQATEEAVTRLTDNVIGLIRSNATAPVELDRKSQEMKAAIPQLIFQYNKEARYFNRRSQVFPVRYIARLFGLDQLHFPEIIMPAALSGDPAHAS